MPSSAEIRQGLVNELRLDLIGPGPDDGDLVGEVFPDPPSRWYLTGFLVPLGAPPRQKAPDPQEEMDTAEEGGADDGETPERGPARPRFLPSSMGLSLLVEPGIETLHVSARWGDYLFEDPAEGEGKPKEPPRWRRRQCQATIEIELKPGIGTIPLPDADVVVDFSPADATGVEVGFIAHKGSGCWSSSRVRSSGALVSLGAEISGRRVTGVRRRPASVDRRSPAGALAEECPGGRSGCCGA